jgi:anti-anti-sigma regulatory factor
MYGNPAFDCDGAQIRAHCRQLATVVTVTGEIGTNIGRVNEHVRRFIIPEKPVILDLSGVNSFSLQSVSLLYTVDEACTAAGDEWALVASQAVMAALRASHDEVPTFASVPDALEHFADVLGERRRLLPLLGKTA